MSIFTIAIIIWVVYQLGVSVLKKAPQQPPRNPTDPLMPDGRPVRETLPGPSKPQGSWLKQIQHAMHESARQAQESARQEEKSTRQMEEGFAQAEPLKTTESNYIGDGYVQTQGTIGLGETSPFERLYTTDLKSSTDENPPERVPKTAEVMIGNSYFMTKEDLTQGIVWAEVLGKPRAMHPFRGPR